MNESFPKPWIYDKLGPAGKRLSRVPRYGLLIARLPPHEFGKLTTEAYTYWKAYTHAHPSESLTDVTGLLDDGLKVKLQNPVKPKSADGPYRLGWHHDEEPSRSLVFRRFQIRLASDMLGALAFRMFCGVDTEGKPKPDYVIKNNVDGFLKNVRKDILAAGAYLDHDDNPIPGHLLEKDWERLKAMDSHGLKHFLFTSNNTEEIRWTDITTQAFFAAHWACRWATPEQLLRTRKWLVDDGVKTNQAYREFWSFAVDMPDEALDFDGSVKRSSWLDLFQPLFDPKLPGPAGDPKGRPIRSTEFIYRAWERIEKWNARLPPMGDDFMVRFQQEFQDIRAGKHGPEKKELADNLVAIGPREAKHGFIRLAHPDSPLERDTGTFLMGAPDGEYPVFDRSGESQVNPLHEVSLSPFLLHRSCVTNLKYELFDPRHQAHRWDGDAHPLGDDALCPVVNVSWYDAWCFAKWVGQIQDENGKHYEIGLPTEARWEYGCRCGLCGEEHPFTFDATRDGKSCEGEFCNFDGNRPWPDREFEHGRSREHTVPVQGGDGIEANRWGFFQMHGNIWEWCLDWFAARFYRPTNVRKQDPENVSRASGRVLRGGSWYNFARFCRSACRNRREPDGRNHHCGFRLAAVPCTVGAQSSK